MRCSNCDKTNGYTYTTIPHKVYCTLFNKYKNLDDGCEIIPLYTTSESISCTRCLICDDIISTNDISDNKVCYKCKEAIRWIRKKMEEEE